MLVKCWSNAGQTSVKYRSDICQTLVVYWSKAGRDGHPRRQIPVPAIRGSITGQISLEKLVEPCLKSWSKVVKHWSNAAQDTDQDTGQVAGQTLKRRARKRARAGRGSKTGHFAGQTRARRGPNTGQTRARRGPNTGQTRARRGPNTGQKRVQKTGALPGRKRVKQERAKRPNSVFCGSSRNRDPPCPAQARDWPNAGQTRVKRGSKTGQTRVNTGQRRVKTGQRRGPKLGSRDPKPGQGRVRARAWRP
jgi:hypothetical protein